MTSPQLPERPNLEQLKKQAKTLLHAAQSGDPAALARFQAQPAFAKKSAAELTKLGLALHDAQSVIAREHGFPSWPALRERVEELTLTFDAAHAEFVRCATGGAPDRAQRLLALHPGIAQASLHAALVLGDTAAIEARLQANPELARQAGGPQEWEPLLYVCHTCLHRAVPERAAGLVVIARRLLALGANSNAQYHWRWHPELPRTALWGALVAMGHKALAEVLLEHGADPTDGVSAHIAGGTPDIGALELLHRHGMKPNGIPGGVPPLVYIFGYGRKPEGLRWLLEHGADANLAWSETGNAPLHVAARRWDVAMVELLVRHGADVTRRTSEGMTAHTVAELSGHAEIAGWLLAHGATDELTPLERFVAACARGDRAAAEVMLRERPSLRGELRPEHHLMLQGPAERGDAKVLMAMLACGFDPHAKDKDNVTPLHRAAMAGHVEATRILLQHGAPVGALDGMFSATPLVWAAEGWSHGDRGGDYPKVARLLIEASSPLEWVAPADTPGPERVHDQLTDLRRAAAEVTSD